MEQFSENGRTWYEENDRKFSGEHAIIDASDTEALTGTIREFLTRENVWDVRVIPTVRGAVSHCDVAVQDEPVWDVWVYTHIYEPVKRGFVSTGVFDGE